MLGIKQAKILLKQLGLNNKQTEQFENLILPHIDFHKYLMEKLDINSEEVEKLTETYSKKYISDKIEDFKLKGGDINTISEDYYFKIAGEAMKYCALENDYDNAKSDILETNMIELSNMFIEIVKNLPQPK